jgi:hypothetical protein
MTKLIAFALDAFGAPLVRYHLAANEGEGAEREARQYLEHRVIEVWSDDHRRIARIVRKPD